MPNEESQFSMEDIMKIAASPVGRQLIQVLQQNGGDQMQRAAEKAAAGDFDSAKEAISGLLRDPQVKKLLEQLGR